MDSLFRFKQLSNRQQADIRRLISGLEDDGLDSLVSGLNSFAHEADKVITARLENEKKKDRPSVGELTILARGIKGTRDNYKQLYDRIKARLWELEGGTARGKGYTPKGGVFFRFTRQPVQRVVNFGRLEEEHPLAFRQCVKRIDPNLEDVGVLYFNELPRRKK